MQCGGMIVMWCAACEIWSVNEIFEYQLHIFMASSLRRNPFDCIPLGSFYGIGELSFEITTQLLR